MTYKSKQTEETIESTIKMVSVLEHNDIAPNCAICPISDKLCIEPADLFKTAGKIMCKRCVVSIAKRKHAFLYIMEYIKKYNKKFFTVANIRRYIESQSMHAETISYSIALIMRDLVRTGFVRVYNERPNGDLYTITGKKIDVTATKDYAVLKGFGCKDGIKA